MNASEIKTTIESAIEQSQCEVNVEGSHVHLTVISPSFAGLNPVKKQQLVYGVLKDAIANGVIHAVHMKTYTPEEWAAIQ